MSTGFRAASVATLASSARWREGFRASVAPCRVARVEWRRLRSTEETTVFKSICIFAGHANPNLAAQIADYLQIPMGRLKISNFSDGEVFCEVQENVRGVDVYVVQPNA